MIAAAKNSSWRMIFSENRYPLFEIMLEARDAQRDDRSVRPAQRPVGLGSRQARSKGSRQAWGATS